MKVEKITRKQCFTALLMLLLLTINTHLNISHANSENALNNITLPNVDLYKNSIIVGGQPSAEDLKFAAEAGVTLVINLRSKGEFTEFDEAKLIKKLGMNYLNISVKSPSDFSKSNIKVFSEQLALSNNKALVHCASGNRVGAYFALEAYYFKGKTKEQAMLIGKKTGITRLTPLVEAIMDKNVQ